MRCTIRANPRPNIAVANFLALAAAEVQRNAAQLIAERHERRRASLLVGAGNLSGGGLHGDVSDHRSPGQRLKRLAGYGYGIGITNGNRRLGIGGIQEQA